MHKTEKANRLKKRKKKKIEKREQAMPDVVCVRRVVIDIRMKQSSSKYEQYLLEFIAFFDVRFSMRHVNSVALCSRLLVHHLNSITKR